MTDRHSHIASQKIDKGCMIVNNSKVCHSTGGYSKQFESDH